MLLIKDIEPLDFGSEDDSEKQLPSEQENSEDGEGSGLKMVHSKVRPEDGPPILGSEDGQKEQRSDGE